ncbi:MAG: hypothetical protein ABFD89_18520 [Bryobacteraceae bacterium]
MLKAILAACALLCALTINADARPRSGPWQSCVPTGDVMRPCSYQPNFLSGVRSIKVKMHRVHHSALGGRPAGCPHAWCGCWLAAYFGISDRNLWRASR